MKSGEALPVVFKITDKVAKEKIIQIRKICDNFTKLFIKWVMEYDTLTGTKE